jgi:hypothetical protein
MSSQPPGWYPDAQGQQRYWDGNQWTEHTAPATGGGGPVTGGGGATAAAAAVSPMVWPALAAAVLTAIGAVGAWATALGESLNGLDTDDGKVVLGIAGASALLLLIGALTRHRWPYVLPLLAGGFAAVITIIDYSDLQDTPVDAGWGLYVAIAGSVLLTVLSLVLLIKPRR